MVRFYIIIVINMFKEIVMVIIMFIVFLSIVLIRTFMSVSYLA